MARTWIRLLVVLLALALVAAACGDDDDSSATGAGEPEDVVELGAETSVDLAECPDDWSATEGVDGDEIRLGISLPQSGQLAAFGAIADGMQAYFDYVNETDPIDGKNITLVARDDAYESGRTVANVEEMLETDELFAFTYIIGSPNNGAIRPILDEACVPQLFSATGLPAWGDPVNWPWTIGGLLAYNTEARLWCENAAAEFGEGVTVAALFMNNDFGKAYQAGVERCAADGLIDLVANEVHEGTAPDIQNEMTNMVASDAEVFIFGSTAAFCPQGVAGVAQSNWRPTFYMSNTCANLASFFEPVKDFTATLAAEGSAVRMVSTLKDFSDPVYADDPAIVLGKQALEDAGLSAAAGSQSTGVVFAYTVEQTLRNALERSGELNRVTLMSSAWNLDFSHPFLLDGIDTITDGANDAYLLEGARIEQILVTDDALTFEPITELISVEGVTGSFSG
jgi:branched-chain amino acid transport system substrate-binding protein